MSWTISEADALERDRKVAAPILRAIIELGDEPAPVIRLMLRKHGYKLQELKRLLPILEAIANK
jgi:hypothetical protein